MEKEEEFDIEEAEKSYKKIKEMLKMNDTKHNRPYIKKQLADNENLRKVLLAVIKNNPSLINEIFRTSLLTKPTCYSQLYKLLDLKLIRRRFYFDILKSSKREEGDKEIIEKFEDFTSKMPENLKRYFQAKTSFWLISEFGKSFAEWAWQKNEEFKEKEKRKVKE